MGKQCPFLHELPPPPPGRTGWPWTVETQRLPDAMPAHRSWPRISVVTPSYNQGCYIEEAIRSVLLQGYPDVQYIIIDGGSRDDTIDVVKRYERWLAYWVSEPDRGATQAFNKGFALATGDLFVSIGSDDLYLPSAFRAFAEAHVAQPEAIIYGDVEGFEVDGPRAGHRWRGHQFNINFRNAVDPLRQEWYWHILGQCVPREIYLKAGPFDERVRWSADVDWVCRLTQHAEVAYVDHIVARLRVHADTTSVVHRADQFHEAIEIVQRYWHLVPGLDGRYTRAVYAVHEAAFHLSYNASWRRHWDRGRALRLLLRALATSPRIAGFALFRSLCRRALLPRRWLRSNPWKPAAGS